MPSCNTSHLLGFLLPWACGISSHCSSKAQPLLLTLDEGYLLTAAIPELQRGIAPLGPPVPVEPPLLELLLPAAGVGGSSQLPSLASDVVCLLPAATDLRHRVAPLGHFCAVAAWHSRPLPRPQTWGTSSWLLQQSTAAVPYLGRGVSPYCHHS